MGLSRRRLTMFRSFLQALLTEINFKKGCRAPPLYLPPLPCFILHEEFYASMYIVDKRAVNPVHNKKRNWTSDAKRYSNNDLDISRSASQVHKNRLSHCSAVRRRYSSHLRILVLPLCYDAFCCVLFSKPES